MATGEERIVPEPTGLRHAPCERISNRTFKEIAMKRKILIAAAVSGALAAAGALAQSSGSSAAGASTGGTDARTTQPQARGSAKGSAALFDRLDKNQDGFVTRDEA